MASDDHSLRLLTRALRAGFYLFLVFAGSELMLADAGVSGAALRLQRVALVLVALHAVASDDLAAMGSAVVGYFCAVFGVGLLAGGDLTGLAMPGGLTASAAIALATVVVYAVASVEGPRPVRA